MKKLHRTALVAGMLAFGVAACGDDVTVLEPTPPPPPPLSVTLTPSNATVAVDEVVDFAVGVSGGDAGATTEVTCASSNTGVATVTTTDSGCRATGVAAGNASITATVTKGNQSSNAGAQVTVVSEAASRAQVSIFSINDQATNAPVDLEDVNGQVNAIINVTPNDETVTEVSLVVIDVETGEETEVASQMFASGVFSEEEAAEVTQQITLSFNTARFDLDEEEGVAIPRHLNGDKQISARVFTVQAGDASPSAVNSVSATFNNEDRFIVTLETDGETAMDSDGLMWRSGALTAQAWPLLYSGNTVTTLNLVLRDADDPTAPVLNSLGNNITAVQLTEGPFIFTYEDEAATAAAARLVGDIEPGDGIVGAVTSSVLSDGNPGPDWIPTGPVTSGDNFVRLDNRAPELADLHLAIREWYWINDEWTFGVTGAAASQISRVDGGVGGVTVDFEAGEDAEALEPVETGDDLDETANDNTYFLRITATDALGNERVRWFVGTDENDQDHIDGAATAAGAGQFGVDKTPPEIGFVAGSSANMAALNAGSLTYNMNFSDPVNPAGGASGFEPDPLRVRTIRTAVGVTGIDTCATGDWVGTPAACQLAQVPAVDLPLTYDGGDPGPGYFELEARVADRAGNVSTTIERIGLWDALAPTLGNVSVPVSLTGGQAATFQVNAQDNVDIADALFFQDFDGSPLGARISFGARQTLGEYGPPLLTSTTVTSTETFVRRLELAALGTPSGTLAPANIAEFGVLDFAGNVGYSESGFTFTPPAGAKASFNVFNISDWRIESEETDVCSGATACAGDEEHSTELTVTLEGATADLANVPFSSIRILWRHADSGVVPRWQTAGTVSAASASDDGLGTRTWSFAAFTFDVPVGLGAANNLEFRVVGIDASGDALVSEPVTVNVVNP